MTDLFRTLRNRFWRWRNDRRLVREQEEYEDRFRRRNLAIPDEAALRGTFKARFPGLQPKARGALHILAVYRNFNWEDEALTPSLAMFGTVHRYDWSGRFNAEGDDRHGGMKAAMNRDLLAWIRERRKAGEADAIFFYLSGEHVFPETMEAVHRLDIPTVNLALNDKEGFVGRTRDGRAAGNRDICRWIDLSWTSTGDAVIKYCVQGGRPIYLPEGANPSVHRPFDVEKILDVSFVGQYYGNRPAVIDHLSRRGIAVEAFGPGWPAGPLPVEDMVKLYSQSRINLGFGGVEGHTEAFCLKGRDFEIPMSGGLYLTEDHPELARAYDIGREIVTWQNPDDLAAKIRHLLTHPDEAEEIRRRGFERARREHTWERRLETVFGILGVIEKEEDKKA
ncbi:MAG: glycosyltransferase [Syntrophaceae bacterium]|nr:glycosyltransferase [Syntrophaceae bacterium]